MLDVAEKVGNLFARVAQITQLTSGKKTKRLFQSQGEYEAEAIKLYTLKQKAQKLQLDTRNLFVGAYGIAYTDENKMEIDERLRGYRYLLYLLHEHFHLKHPDWSETKVRKESSKTARFLWQMGFRLVELK